MILWIVSVNDFSETSIKSKIVEEVDTNHYGENTKLIVNLNSKKYHLPTCKYATVKDEKDLTSLDDEDFLIKHGYDHCEKCIFWR
jgi:hypothetical protein